MSDLLHQENGSAHDAQLVVRVDEDLSVLRMFLQGSREKGYEIRYNLLSCEIEIRTKAEPRWRSLTDIELKKTQAVVSALGLGGMNEKTGRYRTLPLTHVQTAFELEAHAHRVDPVNEYLDRLPDWDGAPRLERFAVEYLRCADSKLARAVGPVLFGTLVARAREPGCKADIVIIVAGEQGSRKSGALRELMHDEKWFSDADLDFEKSTDTGQKCQGIWLAELAECDALSRGEMKRRKAWITRQDDKYRAPYAKLPEPHPRRFCAVGTLNIDESGNTGILNDPTGDRRTIIVESTATKEDPIDTDRIRKDRDQLFAEALVRRDNGQAHWLTDKDLLREQESVNAEHRAHNPVLTERLLDWQAAGYPRAPRSLKKDEAVCALGSRHTDGRLAARIHEVFQHGLQQLDGRLPDMREQHAVAQSLRKLGWQPTRKLNGVNGSFWLAPAGATGATG